ncbi:hypothetical protein J1614_004244 [Plenodomus biglobosus]|nr:hypothetical protein J1614_004244 [Plenodomus biglobosus]
MLLPLIQYQNISLFTWITATMKFTFDMLVALAAVAPAGVIAAPRQIHPKDKYWVHVEVTAGRVDVGDLNLQHETRDWIYAQKGNEYAAIRRTEHPILTFADQCTSHADTQGHREVHVNIDGKWGSLPGLGLNDAREHLIDAAMKTLHADADYTGYNVFTNCWGKSWQEGVPFWKGAHACGGKNPTVRPQCMCGIASAQCESHSWGHIVPHTIFAKVYRGEQPMDPELTITFTSNGIKKNDDCGPIAGIASTLTGLLPGPGSIFSSIIDLACE